MKDEYTLNEVIDDLDIAICDMKKLLFVAESFALFRRGELVNLKNRGYESDLMDGLETDVINLLNQKHSEIELCVRQLEKHIQQSQH